MAGPLAWLGNGVPFEQVFRRQKSFPSHLTEFNSDRILLLFFYRAHQSLEVFIQVLSSVEKTTYK
jgi:hypothetical protein